MPAVSVPVGYDSESGMPIGMQFMAKWYVETLDFRSRVLALRVFGIA